MVSEQEKLPLLLLTIRASTPAHRFQNDGVWEGRGIRDARSQSSLFLQEARWHKQSAERVCCIVVVVVVVVVVIVALAAVVFGWGVNERNEEGNEFHQWPGHNEEVLFEQ